MNTATTSKQNKLYQLTCFFSPLVSEDEGSKIAKNIEDWIASQDGKVLNSGKIERKTLSYPIQKYQEAFCWVLNFNLPPEKIREFEERIKGNQNIIRSLVIHTKKSKPIKEKKPKESLDELKIIDKIEPLPDTKPVQPIQKEKKEEARSDDDIIKEESRKTSPGLKKIKDEKVQIEELDKKLEEILNQ